MIEDCAVVEQSERAALRFEIVEAFFSLVSKPRSVILVETVFDDVMIDRDRDIIAVWFAVRHTTADLTGGNLLNKRLYKTHFVLEAGQQTL